jgi:hypothetical protein
LTSVKTFVKLDGIVAEFGKIDDPVEASFEAWPEEPRDLGKQCSDLALAFEGFALTPAKILKILMDQFATSSRFARIVFLLNGIRLGLRIVESEKAGDREKLKAIEEKLKAPVFSEAVSVACEEAARATNEKKIRQLVAVLVGSVGGSPWADPKEDIPTLIRDIGQLGETDCKVLSILKNVHGSAIATAPNLNQPDAFSRETPTLSQAIGLSQIHPDDFLSACERLRGFGFAAEVLRNTSQMAPHDFCYRPTRRGLAVLDYLSSMPGIDEAAARVPK